MSRLRGAMFPWQIISRGDDDDQIATGWHECLACNLNGRGPYRPHGRYSPRPYLYAGSRCRRVVGDLPAWAPPFPGSIQMGHRSSPRCRTARPQAGANTRRLSRHRQSERPMTTNRVRTEPCPTAHRPMNTMVLEASKSVRSSQPRFTRDDLTGSPRFDLAAGRRGGGRVDAGFSFRVAGALRCASSARVLFAGGEHSGQVTFGGLPVPGATVTATAGDKKLVTATDEQGVFRLPTRPQVSGRCASRCSASRC